PELLKSGKHADARSDVFSLGMTALFGFSGSDIELEDFQHPDQAVDRLTVSSRVKAVLKRATHWKPDRRFPTIRESCEQLREAFEFAEQMRTVTSPAPVDQVEPEKAHGTARPEPPEVVNSIGMKLKLIPAGEFLMGSTKQQIDMLLKHFPDAKREW